MKVSELKLGQQIIINGHKYSYQGVQKIRKSGYTIQQIAVLHILRLIPVRMHQLKSL